MWLMGKNVNDVMKMWMTWWKCEWRDENVNDMMKMWMTDENANDG